MTLYADKDVTVLRKTCPFCTEEWEASVPTEGYQKWIGGELIQKAMPTVPAATREWLISGMCPECQDAIFGI